MNGRVSAGTIARTVALVLALVNQTLSMLGRPVIPIDDKMVETAITLIFTIATSLAAWWKNNSFTEEAIEADKLLEALRAEK